MWFFSIFTKSEEERTHPPPPLKPKRIRRKEEKRERKLQRKAKKREEALQAPPEQRLLEEQAKVIEEVADKAELEESQRCKPDEDTLTNPSHTLHSSDSLSHIEVCEPSGDKASEYDEENSSKSLNLTPSSVCSKGQRIRHKEERREMKRQKRGERKEQEKPFCQTPTPLPRARGGALEDDPNVCKVCKISFQRLLRHLGSSAECAQEYDLQKLHKDNKEKYHLRWG